MVCDVEAQIEEGGGLEVVEVNEIAHRDCDTCCAGNGLEVCGKRDGADWEVC
jgi:hypothetical protein